MHRSFSSWGTPLTHSDGGVGVIVYFMVSTSRAEPLNGGRPTIAS